MPLACQKMATKTVAAVVRAATRPHHNPCGPQVVNDGQNIGRGQADPPVRDHIGHEGQTGFAHASQGPAGHGLGSVDELENRGDAQQNGPLCDNGGLVGHQPHERLGPQPHGERGQAHHATSQRQTHHTAAALRQRISGPHRASHLHGRGIADPDAQGEGTAGQHQRGLVPRCGNGTHGAHQKADTGKQRDLGEHL